MQSTHNCGECWYCGLWPRLCCDKCSTHNTHVCGECYHCQKEEYCTPCREYHNRNYQQFYEPEWSSGDEEIDSLINECNEINFHFEWIPFERFTNVEYLAKGGFATIYKAFWSDGPLDNYNELRWDHKENKFNRWESIEVVLKTLNNTKQITHEFRNEVRDKTFECSILFLFIL